MFISRKNIEIPCEDVCILSWVLENGVFKIDMDVKSVLEGDAQKC